MRWILAATTVLGVGMLARAFLIQARIILRDVNRRFDALQTRLEESANSVVDHLFNSQPVADPDSTGD